MIKIDARELDLLAKSLGDAKAFADDVRASFKDAMNHFVRFVKAEAPRKTGLLVSATGVTFDGLTATVGTSDRCPYAKYVYAGTRAHTIVPTAAKALRFPVAGRFVFSKIARIPARAPVPYVNLSWQRHSAEITDEIVDGVRDAVARRIA